MDKDSDKDDQEELRHLSFHKTEGERDIKDEPVNDDPHLLPLKLQKHNIGIDEKPKLASIGYFRDKQTTKEIFGLLREYEDLFPSLVAKLKGIKGDIGEMKNMLKLDAKLVNHQPYPLNPRVKENVKKNRQDANSRAYISSGQGRVGKFDCDMILLTTTFCLSI